MWISGGIFTPTCMWCSTSKGRILAAVGFLRYKWQHSQNNKENNKNLWSFFSYKILMPRSILINVVSFQSWEKALIHQIHNSKLTSPAKSPLLVCCITSGFMLHLFLAPRVFFLGGGLGGPPIRQKFCQFPPIWHLSPFLDQGLSPPSRGSSPKIWKI